MVDELTYTGLTTKDNLTLVNDLKSNLQDIYGGSETLNLDSNTPDGQFVEMTALLGTVIRQMITEVYNSCDPDKCVGAVQDNRYQINYLERKAGAFTLQNIAITADKTVSLQGLDNDYNNENASAYTVADNNGNNWYLVDSATIYSGTTSLEFRAQTKGYIIPTIGTITNQVTIVDGITNVINSVGPTSIGYEQESDADFRIRRQSSVAANGKNNEDSMLAQILEIDGVVAANYHINRGNTTDSTSTPAHTLWVVVEGGANYDIANTIYANLGGSGTRGSVTVPITTSGLQQISIKFDRETIVPLYIRFDIKPITSLGEINQDDIKEYIAENLTYNIGEDVETSKITQICADAMLSDGGNGYALNVEISDDGTTWTDYLAVSSIADKYTTDVNKITITAI